MKLAFFSPLSPQRSGISDYSEDLLPFLARGAEIDLFTEQDIPPTNPDIIEHFEVFSYTKFAQRQSQRSYDLCLYQMGNNPKFHGYMDELIHRYPGIVTVHDYALQHYYITLLLKGFEPESCAEYVATMERYYGELGEKVGSKFSCGFLHEYPFYQFPLWQRVVEPSLGTVVHSSYVKAKMLHYNSSYQVEMISMGIVPPKVKDYPQERLRKRYEIPQDRFVVGTFGYISPGKRIPELLQAFAEFAKDVPEALCLLVGHLVDPEELPGFDMRKLIKELGIEQKVLITGFIPYDAFFDYIALSDICVNLRFPTVRATSANILKIMAFGKPTLVSDLCENLDLPTTCCVKIPLDEGEQEQLFHSFQRLYQDIEYRKQLGNQARQYVEEFHTVEQAAERYLAFCSKILDAKKK
ncbi:MAG: glycosyltransferase family 4 protein [bacterium]|nr:glycosyltransferase family 4 protein [bacterium]